MVNITGVLFFLEVCKASDSRPVVQFFCNLVSFFGPRYEALYNIKPHERMHEPVKLHKHPSNPLCSPGRNPQIGGLVPCADVQILAVRFRDGFWGLA